MVYSVANDLPAALLTTIGSANMHVWGHRGQRDVVAAAFTPNFCFQLLRLPLSLRVFPEKLRPHRGRAQ